MLAVLVFLALVIGAGHFLASSSRETEYELLGGDEEDTLDGELSLNG